MSNLPILTLFDESGNPIPIPAVGIVGPQGPKGDTGPAGGLDLSITGAKVGQFAEITSVDEAGKPTGWKAVPKPTGGIAESKKFKKLVDYTIPDGGDTSIVTFTNEKHPGIKGCKSFAVFLDYSSIPDEKSVTAIWVKDSKGSIIGVSKYVYKTSFNEKYITIAPVVIDGIWMGAKANVKNDSTPISPNIEPFYSSFKDVSDRGIGNPEYHPDSDKIILQISSGQKNLYAGVRILVFGGVNVAGL